MKDHTLNILAHAFGSKDSVLEISSAEFLDRLRKKGFSEESINAATQWIMQLMQQQFATAPTSPVTDSLRIFSSEETAKLDVDCRNFIMSLEAAQILAPKTREIIIHQLLLLKQDYIGIHEVKLVTLIVLLLQPASTEKINKLERFALKINTQNSNVL